jgi:galactose-1-phosphate uridylyltransferase
MAIKFLKETCITKFLDPTSGFQPNERETEIRVDPLTGRTSRLIYFPIRALPKPDLKEIVERSSGWCPFCPPTVESVTPKFPPDLFEDERIRQGAAMVFPNMYPYDTFSAVAVFSGEHFKPLADFAPDLLRDGFRASQRYLKSAKKADPAVATYCSINWNYMPLSGGTIIHPHLQIISGKTATNYHRQLLDASGRYAAQHGRNYWEEFVEEERRRGERFIGRRGTVNWLASYAPKGFVDISAIFEGVLTIQDITEPDWFDFSRGLSSAMEYLDSKGFWSFNMAIYSGVGEEHFWTHAKLIPRAQLPPMNASDINYFNTLHDEVLSIFRPEDVCQEAKEFFEENGVPA